MQVQQGMGTVLGTRVDRDADAFRRNRERNLELVAQVRELLDEARAGGGPDKVRRHRDRGKLLLRERIQLLLDPGSPWLELSPLIGWGSEYPVGGSSVAGIGWVSGVECLVEAVAPQDPHHTAIFHLQVITMSSVRRLCL